MVKHLWWRVRSHRQWIGWHVDGESDNHVDIFDDPAVHVMSYPYVYDTADCAIALNAPPYARLRLSNCDVSWRYVQGSCRASHSQTTNQPRKNANIMSGAGDREAVFPTRQSLGLMKSKLKAAETGHSLLKRKSEALTKSVNLLRACIAID